MNRRALTALAAALVLSSPAAAQDWDREQVDELGIRYLVHRKLKRVPLRLGSRPSNLRAKYEPYSVSDYIRGSLRWGLQVYEFVDRGSQPTTGGKEEETGPDLEGVPPELAERLRAMFGARELPGTFEKWLDTQRADEVRVKGKTYKKKPPYQWWEYTTLRGQYYNFAASYQLKGREVALVATFPVLKKGRADAKHTSWAKRMLTSVKLLKESQLESLSSSKEKSLEKHANTPERKAALERAKKNIENLDNWDIFTTPKYIVLWSYPPKKRDEAASYYNDARAIAADMDEMRELYKKYYPPPEGMKFPWSVMRICSTRTDFNKYGGTGGGVIGWFSPSSKELVLFNNKTYMKTVAFHEGWHQYSDTYFPDVELHRWFDEGTGDFFGSFRRRGKRWSYSVSDMRRASIKQLVSTEKFVPLADIVTWNKDKFYGRGASNYYAQGYAMVDFLRNGKKRRGWDKAWDDILDNYRKAMLETKDQEQAVEAAWGQVDWEKFTEAWTRWVKAY